MIYRVSILLVVGRLQCTARLRSCTQRTTDRHLRSNVQRVLQRKEGRRSVNDVMGVHSTLIVARVARQGSQRQGLTFRLFTISARSDRTNILPRLKVLLDRRPTHLCRVVRTLVEVNDSLNSGRSSTLILQRLHTRAKFRLVLQAVSVNVCEVKGHLSTVAHRRSTRPHFYYRPSTTNGGKGDPTIVRLLLLLPGLHQRVILSTISQRVLTITTTVIMVVTTRNGVASK